MAVQVSLKKMVEAEYVRCYKDPVYFFKKYCYIQHPDKGRIKFDTYPFQDDTLQQFKDNRYSVVLKSRQLGISTLIAGYSLWLMLFHKDKSILVIATKQDTAKNLVTKVRFMYEELPVWLKVGEGTGKADENNKLSLRLANGSVIKATSASEDAGRSEALSLLVLDEAAFIKNIEEIWTSAQSTVSTGGSVIALSTPNGVGNWFHKVWMQAEAGEKWHPIKLKWNVHPERNQSWRDEQDTILGKQKASQECDTEFLTSGLTVVDGEILQWYKDNMVKDPIQKAGFDNNYWKWDMPNYTKSYIVVADVARGDSSDWSAFHVIDVETITQVAEYKGKLDPKTYGAFLTAVATEWNNALLVIENANIGWATIQEVIDRGYKNLYYSYKDLQYVDSDVQLRKGYDLKSKDDMIPGFTTSTRSRPLIISKLELYMRQSIESRPIINSTRLIDELFVFVWNSGKAQARNGYNDDLVMSFAISLWIRDTALKLRTQGMELTKATLGGFTKTNSVYTPASFRNTKNDPFNMINPYGNKEDLKWLL